MSSNFNSSQQWTIEEISIFSNSSLFNGGLGCQTQF
jgi:hypothetical protein